MRCSFVKKNTNLLWIHVTVEEGEFIDFSFEKVPMFRVGVKITADDERDGLCGNGRGFGFFEVSASLKSGGGGYYFAVDVNLRLGGSVGIEFAI